MARKLTHTIQVICEQDLYDGIRAVARAENRTSSQQGRMILREWFAAREKAHGKSKRAGRDSSAVAQ